MSKKKRCVAHPMHKWTTREINWVGKHIEGVHYDELTKGLNEHFGLDLTQNQIERLCQKYGWHNHIDCQFKKGGVSWNKGKTWDEMMPKKSQEGSRKTCFKKGQSTWNHKPVGSTRVDKDGYILIKVKEPRTWKYRARYNWEQVNGKLGKGLLLYHLDGNPKNDDVSNLYPVTQAQHVIICRNHMKVTGEENIKTMINIAELMLIAGGKQTELYNSVPHKKI